MTDTIGMLNGEGVARFQAWISATRAGAAFPAPISLLTDETTSEPLSIPVAIERQPYGRPFDSRLEFGSYLCSLTRGMHKTVISRQSGLWNWLSLYYIDQLAPPDRDGARELLANEAYLLGKQFSYKTYYRHLVRTPWLASLEHGESSDVLLVPASSGRGGQNILGVRGEITEQLAARQWVLGSTSLISAASRLYMDPKTRRPRRGAGGSAAGSPRRLAIVVQQLELTYDLRDCTVEQVLNLLPEEFDRWKKSVAA